MKLFLAIVAGLLFVSGLFVFAGAQSAVHEILAAILVGFGVLVVGLFGVIQAVEDSADKVAARIAGLR